MMTLRLALAQAAQTIDRRDADVLLAHALGCDRAWLRAHADDPLSPSSAEAFFSSVTARATHKPLQYITGHQEFYGLDLQLSPATLIPRPETEVLVEHVLAWTSQLTPPSNAAHPLQVADVGTGSGAIALALAAHLPHALLYALDLSGAVRPIVEANASRLGLSSRVRFIESDLLAGMAPLLATGRRLDAVVSNPPYIPQGDLPGLQPEVRDYEPHTALFAGEDGLAIYRRLIPEARACLRDGGLLAMEFGFGQREAIANLLQDWYDIRLVDDLAGIPRVALAIRPPR